MSASTALVHVPRAKRPDSDVQERAEIVERVSDLIGQGCTRAQACAQVGVPVKTVVNWITGDAHLWTRYAVARIEQAHTLADEMLDIARSRSLTMTEAQDKRSHIDALKWRCAKLHPRTYGDARQLEITGADGGAIRLALQVWGIAGRTLTF